jgi:hypothetical protein
MEQDCPQAGYSVSIKAANIYEAIAALASALYSHVEEALAEHEGHEEEECEFEGFARDVLSVLDRHADQLGGDGTVWEPPDEDSTYG